MILHYIEGDDNKDSEYVKHVLNAALKAKVDELEELKKLNQTNVINQGNISG